MLLAYISHHPHSQERKKFVTLFSKFLNLSPDTVFFPKITTISKLHILMKMLLLEKKKKTTIFIAILINIHQQIPRAIYISIVILPAKYR